MITLNMDYIDRTQRLANQWPPRPGGADPEAYDEAHENSPTARRSAVNFTGSTADLNKTLGGTGRALRNVGDPQNAMFLIAPHEMPVVQIENLQYVRYLDLQFQPEQIFPLFRDG